MTNSSRNALQAFETALERATATGRRNMNAMSIATIDAAGAPAVRTVLLRRVDERGLIFFTDARSNKGRELARNPVASACFYWEPIEEQARIDGRVEQLTSDDVAADFTARPRSGQVLIWASAQSQPLASKDALREAVARTAKRLADPAPCPQHWAGYRLVPHSIELWRGARDRLHERTLFEREGEEWTSRLLQP